MSLSFSLPMSLSVFVSLYLVLCCSIHGQRSRYARVIAIRRETSVANNSRAAVHTASSSALIYTSILPLLLSIWTLYTSILRSIHPLRSLWWVFCCLPLTQFIRSACNIVFSVFMVLYTAFYKAMCRSITMEPENRQRNQCISTRNGTS